MHDLPLRFLVPVVSVIAALLGGGVVQVAYLTSPIVPVALAVAAALAVLSIARPLVALYAAVALAPLELMSFGLGSAGVSPAEGMFIVAGLGWAASRMMRGELPFEPSPLGKPLALFVLAVVPGIAIAPEPFAVVKVLVIWSALLLVYQMIVVDGRPETVRNILFVLALSGAVVGAIAITKSGGTAPELQGAGETAVGRAEGSFGHPNTLATFEALALPGALALGLKGPAGIRPAALGSFAVIFAGLALSLSRGGLLAVAGALGTMLAWAPFRRTAITAGLVIGILAVSGANPLGDSQLVQVLSKRLESVTYSAEGVDPRFRVWQVSPQIIEDHPLLGIGENAFPQVAQRYGLLLENSRATYEHAHNIPLTIAVELGLVGFAILLWLTVALAQVLMHAYRRSHRDHRGMVIAVAAAFVALALQGMVDYTLRLAVIVAVVFMLAGCAVVLARGREGTRREPALRPRRSHGRGASSIRPRPPGGAAT